MSIIYPPVTAAAMSSFVTAYGAVNAMVCSSNPPWRQPFPAECIDTFWGQLRRTAGKFIPEYRAAGVDKRVGSQLSTAHRMGFIPNIQPLYLTGSPFGWHGLDFINLLLDRDLPLGDPKKKLHVGSFGAGLHDEFEFAVEAAVIDGIDRRSASEFYAPIGAAQKELYDGLETTTFEPRELLALFLSGKRRGSVTAVDRVKAIGKELKQPRFARLDIAKHLPVGPYRHPSFHNAYWKIVATERAVVTEQHGILDGSPLESERFEFTPAEMSKIKFVEADFLDEDVPIPSQSFDLSVWLESYPFFPQDVSALIAATIVDRTKLGGFMLFDYPVSTLVQNQFGIEAVRALSNPINRPSSETTSPYAHLYRRVEETEGIGKALELLRNGS